MKFCFSDTTANRAMMLVAPADVSLQPFTGRITRSTRLHAELIAAMQRHRGKVYLEDSAIAESELTGERHVSPVNLGSWHLLIMGVSGKILGCTRFRRHPNSVSAPELAVSRAPLARCSTWGGSFRASIDSELASARQAGFAYVEVGGWALDHDVRGTADALKTVLATYALGQVQGGAIAISTATKRHGSADILRRLGGRPLEWQGTTIPAYYDESYGCTMEVLRFDSRYPNPRYARMIRDLRSLISRMPIVCPGEESSRWSVLLHNLFNVPAFQTDASAVRV